MASRYPRRRCATLGARPPSVPGATYVLKNIAGGWQRDDLPGDHPLIGRSAPDLRFDDGTALADHGHDGRALLVDLAGNADLRKLALRWADRLTVIAAKPAPTNPAPTSNAALFVRPDGHVAWATATTATDLTSAEHALTTWLGTPSRHSAHRAATTSPTPTR
jgi:hypothetical protein